MLLWLARALSSLWILPQCFDYARFLRSCVPLSLLPSLSLSLSSSPLYLSPLSLSLSLSLSLLSISLLSLSLSLSLSLVYVCLGRALSAQATPRAERVR